APNPYPIIDRAYPSPPFHRGGDLPRMPVNVDEFGIRQKIANDAQTGSRLRRIRQRAGAAGKGRRISVGGVLVAPDRLADSKPLAIEQFDAAAAVRPRETQELLAAPGIQQVGPEAALFEQILQQHEHPALVREPDVGMLIQCAAEEGRSGTGGAQNEQRLGNSLHRGPTLRPLSVTSVAILPPLAAGGTQTSAVTPFPFRTVKVP